jgi:protoporphyrinogen oxidase
MVKKHLSILGAGIGGLAAGYFARKCGLTTTIYEAAPGCGGNATTIRWGDFLFDTGAHRLHDCDGESWRDYLELLGNNLERIDVPSQILSRGKRFDFPLKPLDLLDKLGPSATFKAAVDFLSARKAALSLFPSFESFAVASYGRAIAERFLLGYSQKLWGAPPWRLAPEISGRRLHGLGLRSFIRQVLPNNGAAAGHLDGTFFYPRENGIGAVVESLRERCGRDVLLPNTEITRVFHDGSRIRALELNGRGRTEVEEVISAIPLTTLLSRLEPPLPAAVLQAGRRLRFRHLVLVALFLNRPRITPFASIYFPDPEFPFTRVYEPKNRCLSMAPPSQTSLVAEIPCQESDPFWSAGEAELLKTVSMLLCRAGFLQEGDMLGGAVRRLHSAYPVLEKSSIYERQRVFHHLAEFANLSLTGRSGLFLYTHIHDQLRRGREIVAHLADGSG